MNASHLMGMATLCLLSACTSGSREIHSFKCYRQPLQSQISIAAKPALLSASKEEHHTREYVVAYGQVLSFWAGHLK